MSDDSIADPWASSNNTITYVVTVADSNNCTATDSIMLSVNALPVADAGANTSVCSGDSVQLNASGGTTYTWLPASSLSDANVQNPWASPQDTTTYTVIVQDSIGCSGTDSIVVSVLIIPLVTASADTAICLGDAITISATGNGTYLWSTGETTQSITAAPTNDSLYIVSSNNACGSDSDSIWVLVNLLPSASAGADITIYLGESVPLNGSGGPAYSWVPTTGLDCPTCENPTASPLETTTYYVTVTV